MLSAARLAVLQVAIETGADAKAVQKADEHPKAPAKAPEMK